MKEIVAGAASGFLMGLVFITAGSFMLLSLTKDPSALLRYVLKQVPMVSLAIPVAAISLALGGVVGLILGVMYWVAEQFAPGGGLGSPNLVFTLAVAVLGLGVFLPFVLLARSSYRELVAMFGGFIGIFGWFLPYLAS